MNNKFVTIFAFAMLAMMVTPAFAVTPIASWDFDEGSGSVAYDSVSSYDCTIYNGTWSSGKFGDYALSFFNDGVTASQTEFYADCGDVSFCNNDFSMSMWIKTVSGNNDIVQKDTDVGGGGVNEPVFELVTYSYVGGSGRLYMYVTNNFSDFDSAEIQTNRTGLADNEWHHIVVIRNGHDWFIYEDGVLDSENVTDTWNSSQLCDGYDNFMIGQASNAYNWNGTIDSFKVYSGVLTDTQIKNLYYCNDPDEPCLLHEWTFDEGSGTTAYDSAGSVNCSFLNPPDYVAGVLGYALYFDGSDALNCTNDPSFDLGTGNWSYEFWFNASELDMLMATWDGASGFFLGVNGLGSLEYDDQVADYVTSLTDVRDSTWHHGVITRDSTNLTVYIDGVDDTDYGNYGFGGESADSDGDFLIGAYSDFDFYNFTGQMDNVRIWSGALSDEEIGNLYLYNQLDVPAPEEEPELTGMGAVLGQIGAGLGSFLSAIFLHLGNLALIFGIVSAVVSIFLGIVYIVKRAMG